MPILKVYTVFDRVSEESGMPVLAKNDGQALRDFLFGIPEEKLSDFRLYYHGTYDTSLQKFDLISAPKEIERAI